MTLSKASFQSYPHSFKLNEAISLCTCNELSSFFLGFLRMVNEYLFLSVYVICKYKLLRELRGLGGRGSHSDGGIRNYFVEKKFFRDVEVWVV